MSVFKDLFLVVGGNVSIFQFDEVNHRFDNISHMGETYFSVDRFTWEWWQDSVSFNAKRDTVDFCFVVDDPATCGMGCVLNRVEVSHWNVAEVKQLVATMVDVSKVSLQDGVSKKCYLPNDLPALRLFAYFQTPPNEDVTQEAIEPLTEVKSNIDTIDNPLAYYFKSLKDSQLYNLT